MHYLVSRTETLPDVRAGWLALTWSPAEPLTIAGFHPRSSAHRPLAQARLLHDGHTLAVIFRVEDRYVLARATDYQSPTHKDSCVELFVRPRSNGGYFNLEFNAIGALLLWYIDKPRRPDGSFEHYVEVPRELAETIPIHASQTEPILDEDPHPLVWTVAARIPVSMFENFLGPIGDLSGQTWRANFYKCADESSHPHWGAWSNIGQRLDFHQPDRFGELVFE